MSVGYNDYRTVVDSLADICYSSKVSCTSLDDDNRNNRMTVKQLFNLFNDISRKQSDCYNYNGFTSRP